MRYPASVMVLVLAVVAIVVGVFVGRDADTTSSVAAENEIVIAQAAPVADAAEVAAVTTGGSGSTPTESADASEQEWVRVPGTGVAIWPKPRTTAD